MARQRKSKMAEFSIYDFLIRFIIRHNYRISENQIEQYSDILPSTTTTSTDNSSICPRFCRDDVSICRCEWIRVSGRKMLQIRWNGHASWLSNHCQDMERNRLCWHRNDWSGVTRVVPNYTYGVRGRLHDPRLRQFGLRIRLIRAEGPSWSRLRWSRYDVASTCVGQVRKKRCCR